MSTKQEKSKLQQGSSRWVMIWGCGCWDVIPQDVLLHQFGIPEGVRLLPGVESSDGKETTRVELQLDGSIGVFDDDWDDRLGVMMMNAEPTLIHREKGFLGDVWCNPTHKAYQGQTHG